MGVIKFFQPSLSETRAETCLQLKNYHCSVNCSEKRKTSTLFGVFGYRKITNSGDSHHQFSTCAWFMPHLCISPTSHSHVVLSQQDHGRRLFFSFAFSTLTSKLFSPNCCLLLVQVTFPACWEQLFIQVDRAGHKVIVLTVTMSGYVRVVQDFPGEMVCCEEQLRCHEVFSSTRMVILSLLSCRG